MESLLGGDEISNMVFFITLYTVIIFIALIILFDFCIATFIRLFQAWRTFWQIFQIHTLGYSVGDSLYATSKVVGVHKIDKKSAADWNVLPKSELFTTTASKIAENGTTILEIMLAGSWKSETIARTNVNFFSH